MTPNIQSCVMECVRVIATTQESVNKVSSLDSVLAEMIVAFNPIAVLSARGASLRGDYRCVGRNTAKMPVHLFGNYIVWPGWAVGLLEVWNWETDTIRQMQC